VERHFITGRKNFFLHSAETGSEAQQAS
jgi:hypothetical protein